MNDSYCLYMHTFPNNKKYIGITKQKTSKRWSNGKHYKSQVVGRAIQKYGWDNIKHEILFSNLTKEQAMEYEQNLIKKYKTNQKKYGYNKSIGGEIGRKDNYMCEEAIQFINNSYTKSYDEYKKIYEWWKWLCKDELESKVFNGAFNYVNNIAKKIGFKIEDYDKVNAINLYLESWQNNWTPECAEYNSKYYLENSEEIRYNIIFNNNNDSWKKKINIIIYD